MKHFLFRISFVFLIDALGYGFLIKRFTYKELSELHNIKVP